MVFGGLLWFQINATVSCHFHVVIVTLAGQIMSNISRILSYDSFSHKIFPRLKRFTPLYEVDAGSRKRFVIFLLDYPFYSKW